MPPLPDQLAIATFLDRKTAVIDALVEKKRKLVQLLAEKRAALINQAVTKGLDPTVPMKDSGIPWIGDIPANWEIRRLRQVCSQIFLGLTSKVDYVEEGGVPLIRALDFSGGKLRFDLARSISQAQHRMLTRYRSARRGDVLLSKSGSIGTVALVDTDREFSIYESVFVLRGIASVISSVYLMRLLQAESCIAQYERNRIGMGVHHLNMSDFIDVKVAIPPYVEQVKIIKSVETGVKHIDDLRERLMDQISRLQELRQALITAAVTGQLEVPVEPSVPAEALT